MNTPTKKGIKTNKLVNYCWKKCRGLCNETFIPDCLPMCHTYCVDKEASPEIPPQVMKKWEDLYDEVMKRSDVGCQPYFAPPGPKTAQQITRRLHLKQTTYQDDVHKVLLRQILPPDEKEEENLEEELGKEEITNRKTCSQADQDLIKLLNTPSIEMAHREYIGKLKSGVTFHSEKEESSLKTTSQGQIEKTTINPDIKRMEFIRIAQTMTDIDEEILNCVEKLWSAVGPLLIERNNLEKVELLENLKLSIYEKMGLWRIEHNRHNAENAIESSDFARGLSVELDKKYDAVLDEIKAKLNEEFDSAIECLLNVYENQNRYEIEWYRNESIEKYQERIRIFTQFCNLWMKVMESANRMYNLNERQKALKDMRLIAEVQRMEEMRILKSVASLNVDHEQIQAVLADILYKRDQTIGMLKENIEELQKKVDIWKNLVNDLLTQFQKFVTFALNEQPVQTQYLLSLNELYNQFLEDYLQAERAAVTERDTVVERVRATYPSCDPPDRLSRGSTSTITPDTTSSAGTDSQAPESQIPEYLMSAITSGVYTPKPPSYDELVYRKEQEVEAVVQTFGYEPSDNSTWDTQSTENFKEVLATGQMPTPRNASLVIEEDCSSMDKSTKNKIDIVLSLLHNRPQLMKGFLTL